MNININFSKASSLAIIDSQIEYYREDISPSEYEIIRQVIYHTADFEYYSLLKFAQNPLVQGLNILKTASSIVVDVPEIQVSIVPQLQQTFKNPVYCCATTGKQVEEHKTRAVFGLESLAVDHSNSIFVIGQDRDCLNTLVELVKNKTINPSLAIITAPSLLNSDAESYFKYASIPTIYVDSPKGGATVATAIFKALINLTWRASIAVRK